MENLKIRLTFTDERKPYLLDISSLFYDFELLHDFLLIIYAKEYNYYKFNQYFWYRKGRPIDIEHRIKTAKILKESPLTIELILSIIVGTSGAFWALIQAIEKISNWILNKKKLRLEIEKLEKEKRIKFYEEEKARIEFEQKLLERDAWSIFNSLIRRIEANTLKLEDIEILRENGPNKKDKYW